MDLFTHSIIGAFVFLKFIRGLPEGFIYWAIFSAILPDLDIILIPLKKKFNSKYLEHRGGSHSYFTGIIVTAVISLIFSSVFMVSFLITWIIGIIFYSLHVSMDLLTTTKIPIFFPISKKEFSFYVEKAGSLFTMLISVLFLAVYSPLYFNSAGNELLMALINLFSIFFLIYYFYRIFSKLWFKSRFNNNMIYLPGVLPNKFALFSFKQDNNDISAKLIMKNHFAKDELLYNCHMTLSNKQIVILDGSLVLCRSEYYFSKWTLLPILFKNEDLTSVRIYFLETLINKKTSFIQYDYDELSGELKGFNRGFSSILSLEL